MKIELEAQDIEAIAQRIADILKPHMGGQDSDEILTTEQVADLLNMKPSAIYSLVDKQKTTGNGIPHYKVGNLTRFSKKAVLEWLSGH